MRRNGCPVNHFRMVTINIAPQTAPANPENPWQKVLTRWSRAVGEGATAVSVSALGATMQDVQQPVWRPSRTCSRRCRLHALAQEPQSLQSLLRCASRGRR